jgi:hypothetical protein
LRLESLINRPANPAAGISKTRGTFLLLPGGEGRDEGGRSSPKK